MTRPTTPRPSIERLAASLLPADVDAFVRLRAGRLAGRLLAVPGVRGGQPGQDPQEARRCAGPRVAPRRPCRAAGRAPAPRRPPDRARLRGLRLRQGRTRLHGHVSRDADAQRGGDPAAAPPRSERRRRIDRGEAPPAPTQRVQRPGPGRWRGVSREPGRGRGRQPSSAPGRTRGTRTSSGAAGWRGRARSTTATCASVASSRGARPPP